MSNRLSDKGRRAIARVARSRKPAGKNAVAQLRKRVTELENEMQETRRLNRRVAELLDIVEELLVPLAQRDVEKVQKYLDSHASSL
jgi:hypothetical protein